MSGINLNDQQIEATTELEIRVGLQKLAELFLNCIATGYSPCMKEDALILNSSVSNRLFLGEKVEIYYSRTTQERLDKTVTSEDKASLDFVALPHLIEIQC